MRFQLEYTIYCWNQSLILELSILFPNFIFCLGNFKGLQITVFCKTFLFYVDLKLQARRKKKQKTVVKTIQRCLKIWMLLPKKDRLIVLTCTKRALDLVVAETRSISDFLYGTFAPWIIRKLTYLISWRSIFCRCLWAFLFVSNSMF